MSTKLHHGLFLTLLCVMSAMSQAGEPEPTAEIEQLMLQLNADRFGIRRQAYLQILAAGEGALPDLLLAADSASAQQRELVQQLIREIRLVSLKKSFAKIIRAEDAAIDLDEGMIMIARILEPDVDRDAIERQLDDLADSVRGRLGDVIPSEAPPLLVVNAIIGVLRDDFRLSGSVNDYDDPNNSSLRRVFATRRGLPILISHVAVSVAERLEIPLVGLAVPRRYMIKYDGSQAPFGEPTEDIIIDPFGNWQILTSDEVKKVIPSFDPRVHLAPSPRRESLARMLRNLVSDLHGAGATEKAADTRQILLLLENSREVAAR